MVKCNLAARSKLHTNAANQPSISGSFCEVYILVYARIVVG